MPPSERTLGPFGWKVTSDGNDDVSNDDDAPDDDAPDDAAPDDTSGVDGPSSGADDGSGDDEGTEDEKGSPQDEGPPPEEFEEGDDRITAERELGPMNWRVAFGGETAPEADRTTSYEGAAGRGEFPGYERRPRESVREGAVAHEGWTIGSVRRTIALTAVLVGVGLILLIDTMSMMVPPLASLGSGLVGGFVAGYVAGGTLRGAINALVAGVIGGLAVGGLTATIGVTIGLFMEPATLVGDRVGIISPQFSGMGLLEPLLISAVLAAMIVLDATVAGGIGGTLRSLVDDAR